MTIGRTDDPESPSRVSAFKAARLFGTGSRNPSGPAVTVPRQQGRTHERNRPARQNFASALEPKGPSLRVARPRFNVLLLVHLTHLLGANRPLTGCPNQLGSGGPARKSSCFVAARMRFCTIVTALIAFLGVDAEPCRPYVRSVKSCQQRGK